MESFSSQFLTDTLSVIGKLDQKEIENAVRILRDTRERGGRLFLCGSGGGAGHASHATCDFRKLCGFEAYSVSDNISELTARTNDDGWDTSYSNWLRASKLTEKDCLLFFSVGGGSIEPPVSTNLVNAGLLAQEVGADIVSIVGRDGGQLKKMSSSTILIPTLDPKFVTPQAEGLQAVVWHLLVSHPSLCVAEAKWESLVGTTK
jgi:D-sedoheptulose 7-phosphate isomerase